METLALNDMLDQIDLIDMYNTPFKNSRIILKYTWNILQDRSYVKSRKVLNKFKESEII